jgi:hypothetical protein
MSRNRYLLLGVDYGAPPAIARRAFARAAKRVRRAYDTDVTVEELNHALHEIQTDDGDPTLRVDLYRVPADPEVFTPTGPGVMTPDPRPLPRTSGVDEGPDLRPAVRQELDHVLDVLTALTVQYDYGYTTHQGGTTA